MSKYVIHQVEPDGDDTLSVMSASTTVMSDVHRVLPPEVKRLQVVRDTGETVLHKAARMGYVVSIKNPNPLVLYSITVWLCSHVGVFTMKFWYCRMPPCGAARCVTSTSTSEIMLVSLLCMRAVLLAKWPLQKCSWLIGADVNLASRLDGVRCVFLAHCRPLHNSRE